MLYNYTQQYGVQLDQTAVTAFTDEGSVAAYALPAVQALHRAGVINGMPDGSFQPYATATREQACTELCMLKIPALQTSPGPGRGTFFVCAHRCPRHRAADTVTCPKTSHTNESDTISSALPGLQIGAAGIIILKK